MKEIKLPRGFTALVDDEDYEGLRHYSWQVFISSGIAYARRNRLDGDAPGAPMAMHREIVGACPPGSEVDHIEHQPLSSKIIDNRRKNLRFATRSQNCANQRKTRGMSIFKGVSLHVHSGLWRATLNHLGKHLNVGYFKIEVHAAYAYDVAAVRLRGEFARTNFPVPGSHAWIFGEAP